MMEKVKLTVKQAEMIKNHDGHLRDLMFKWHAKGCSTFIDDLTAEQVLDAYFDGYEVEPEFRSEDWVVYMKKGDCHEKVAKTTHVGLREYTVQEGPNNFYTGNIKGLLRHATPEEIKAEQERRVWAGIGREVREFRDGDVGVSYSESIWTELSSLRTLHDSDDLKGFYPAESFISFRGESHDN